MVTVSFAEHPHRGKAWITLGQSSLSFLLEKKMIRQIKNRPPIELDAKRFDIPLEADCPVCNTTIVAYDIDYPVMNGENETGFYCEHDDTDFADQEPWEETCKFMFQSRFRPVKNKFPSHADPRNVTEEFKRMPEEEIKEALQQRALPFAVCIENFQGDFNIGTTIRNANGFGAKEVFYIGKRQWDRRGACGTQNYTGVTRIDWDKLKELKKTYTTFVGVDNISGPKLTDMETYQWPDNCLMIFGEEGTGLTPEMVELCDVIVSIEMRGSVRSFNAGTSSGIAMYDFANKRNK